MKYIKVLRVLKRDVKSGMRDFMIIFVAVVPIILAILLNIFLPNAENVSLRFAMKTNADKGLIEAFQNYGDVILRDSSEFINERVNATDEVIGIDFIEGRYKIIMQGNEREGVTIPASMILDEYFSGRNSLIDVKITNMGHKDSPLRRLGSLFLFMYSLMAPGLMVGLNLVEEKESNTLSALNVSPLTRWELYLGKILFGIIISIFHVYAVTFILGFGTINLLMLLVVSISSIFIALVMGFFIGAITDNQVGAIAALKFSFTPVMISFAGAIIIPVKWQILLYWSPFYWNFTVLEKILLKTAKWPEVFLFSGLIIATSMLFYLLLRKKIISGLQG